MTSHAEPRVLLLNQSPPPLPHVRSPPDVMPVSNGRTRSMEEELHANYVDERHIQAFAQALAGDDLAENDTGTPDGAHTPLLTAAGTAHPPPSPRVRKVTALSDFAPVHLRVKRRRKGRAVHERRQEWLFLIVRWPLLIFIFLFIFFEFSLYILIRQCVNAKEWFTAWRGQKGILRKRLRAAGSYDEWKDAARTLDAYLQFDEWKAVDEDLFYDWRLVRKVLGSLRRLREKEDVRGVLGVLETCIRTNFAGVESARLYSETFLGTKHLIESYIMEVEKSLVYIRESAVLSVEEKRRFFKSANTNLGVSALCLSGGASFGYYHFGVLRAFVRSKLLPRVLTGTSAGALVAAFACTRTDAELEALLVPALADNITACEEPFSVWFRRFWKTGARFDSVDWARKACFFTCGSLTFKEAYMRTGRILNVSVIPADRHSPTKLLNYMTAPDTVIWSALIASAAVPGILNPVVLMKKARDGSIGPWNWGSKFKDGSLRVDIPLQELNMYFNVTHPVVSQVNPHVHLFFFAPRGSAGKPVAHRKGKGWRGNFLLSAAEQWLKLELTKNFKLIRDLDLLPQLLGQDWSSVFLQRFDGTVTIWPKTRFKDWVRILSDPDRRELERMITVGEYVSWPKLHIIENRYRLEREIFRGRQTVRQALHTRERAPLPPGGLSSADAGNLPDSTAVTSTGMLGAGVAPTLSDAALALDSDTDTGYANGALMVALGRARERERSRPLEDVAGTSTPQHLKKSLDPLRSPSRRRRWASQLFGEDAAGGTQRSSRNAWAEACEQIVKQEERGPQLALDASARTTLPQSRSFLARLRSRSFSRFTSPFSKISVGKAARQETPPNDKWSSDSSEDDIPLHGDSPFSPRATHGSGVFKPDSYFAYTPEGEPDDSWSRDDEDKDIQTLEPR